MPWIADLSVYRRHEWCAGAAFTLSSDRYIGKTPRRRALLSDPADRSTTAYGEADSEAEADADGDADSEADADSDADADGDTDAEAEAEGGSEGSGTGVGSGMKRDGMPAMERTITRTKMARTVRIHGRASRSSRAGSEPR